MAESSYGGECPTRDAQDEAHREQHTAQGLLSVADLLHAIPRRHLGAVLPDQRREAERQVERAGVVRREAAQDQQHEAEEAERAGGSGADARAREDAAVEPADGKQRQGDDDEAHDAADQQRVGGVGDDDRVHEGIGLVGDRRGPEERLDQHPEEDREQLIVQVHHGIRLRSSRKPCCDEPEAHHVAGDGCRQGHRELRLTVRRRREAPGHRAQAAHRREGPCRKQERRRQLHPVVRGHRAAR
mmetsp:Transcript_66768/g.195951  ORF Transcript_66768/g.195951 Transcript_66768/m.195951 type:complete len:243 (+) Transcript_66768:92-820(+)